MKRMGVRNAFVTIVLMMMATFAGAAEIEPPDVYKAVTELGSDIEQVRVAMGRPQAVTLELRVVKVERRHIYFLAQASFNNANALAQKVAGTDWGRTVCAD
jgi:hypothetical protein